jgi:ribose-phosphate pyrophosphokinase
MSEARAIFAFPEDLAAAEALAAELRLPCREIHLHRFPDGESLVRIDQAAARPLLYRSLAHPNDKLIELLLACDSLADQGTERPQLVAPYLPYMRQDMAFHPGEAVSQRAIGRLLAQAFSLIVAVDPHLHRTHSLDAVFPGCQTLCLSAAPVLAGLVGADRPLLVGPDEESAPLVRATAAVAGLDWLVMRKTRHGDDHVAVSAEDMGRVTGRGIVLVDDVCSTGATLAEAARLVLAAGAAKVEALVVHAMHGAEAERRIGAVGIARLRSTDSLPHASNAGRLAPLIAAALREVAP